MLRGSRWVGLLIYWAHGVVLCLEHAWVQVVESFFYVLAVDFWQVLLDSVVELLSVQLVDKVRADLAVVEFDGLVEMQTAAFFAFATAAALTRHQLIQLRGKQLAA